MKKPTVICVTITQTNEDDRWKLIMADVTDGRDNAQILASVCLNQGISRYLRSTLAMVEDDLPEQN
jgi:hypothetical protein